MSGQLRSAADSAAVLEFSIKKFTGYPVNLADGATPTTEGTNGQTVPLSLNPEIPPNPGYHSFFKASRYFLSLNKMAPQTTVVCVTTSKPTLALTPAGGGGSLTMLCPQTGSVLSSFRSNSDGSSSSSLLGVASLSPFPSNFSQSDQRLLLAYGATIGNKNDTYGMLLTARSAGQAPLLHWKCRLPENSMPGGLSVSPCGHYIVGGGDSGKCYVWKSLGGLLLRTFSAHYRSVTCLSWTKDGSFLLTGGADGMVHLFSLLELVDQEDAASDASSSNAIAPLRSWSLHHLPVTVLTPILCGSSYRMATGSEDGQIHIIDVYMGEDDPPLCTFSLPNGICSLISHVGVSGGQHLLAGTSQGNIYLLDLDLYAVHVTQQQTGGAATVVGFGTRHGSRNDAASQGSRQDPTVEGDYQTALVGHEKAVTGLAVVPTVSNHRGGFDLVSGDESGTMRIWDLESRVCRRVIRPWAMAERTVTATATTATTTGRAPVAHPVTTLLVWEQDNDHDDEKNKGSSLFLGSSRPVGGKSRHSSAGSSLIHLVTPLQRFQNEVDDIMMTPVPFLQSSSNIVISSGQLWDEDDWQMPTFLTAATSSSGPLKKRKLEAPSSPQDEISVDASMQRNDGAHDHNELETSATGGDATILLQAERDRVRQLQHELEEAKSTIQRWEVVNNKLMTKLQK